MGFFLICAVKLFLWGMDFCDECCGRSGWGLGRMWESVCYMTWLYKKSSDCLGALIEKARMLGGFSQDVYACAC